MGRALKARGFEYTCELENADALLINTCTVRQHAEGVKSPLYTS